MVTWKLFWLKERKETEQIFSRFPCLHRSINIFMLDLIGMAMRSSLTLRNKRLVKKLLVNGKIKAFSELKFCLPTTIIFQILRSLYILASNLFQFFCHPCLLAHLLCYSNLPPKFRAVCFLASWLNFDTTPRVSFTFLFFLLCCGCCFF